MISKGRTRILYLLVSSLIFVTALPFSTLPSCSISRTTGTEILIALRPEAIPHLIAPKEPDPLHTGISSLDSLNRKWNVHRMIRVFPDVSPEDETAVRHGLAGIYKLVVPQGTDLVTMIRDYKSDRHIDYAELNQPYEIK